MATVNLTRVSGNGLNHLINSDHAAMTGLEVELVGIFLTPSNRSCSGERPGHNQHVGFGAWVMKRETRSFSGSHAGEIDLSGQCATP